MSKRKAYTSRWTVEETIALIEARAKFDQEFKKKTSQYHVIWRLISSSREELSSRVSNECSKKWNNLLDTYKKLKDPKTGTAPTSVTSENWPYFTIINDFMAQKHNVEAPFRIDSLVEPNVMSDNFDLIEYDPDPEMDEVLEESLAATMESQASTSRAIVSPSTSYSIVSPPAKKKKETILDHIKARDKRIIKSIERNDRIIKKVVEKYFPDVVISSSSESD